MLKAPVNTGNRYGIYRCIFCAKIHILSEVDVFLAYEHVAEILFVTIQLSFAKTCFQHFTFAHVVTNIQCIQFDYKRTKNRYHVIKSVYGDRQYEVMGERK